MKIVLIAPSFFDYYKYISDKFNENGHDVKWYNDRPSEKILIR